MPSRARAAASPRRRPRRARRRRPDCGGAAGAAAGGGPAGRRPPLAPAAGGRGIGARRARLAPTSGARRGPARPISEPASRRPRPAGVPPVGRAAPSSAVRAAAAIGAELLGRSSLVVVVGGVAGRPAACPRAEITVTPAIEPVGPISLTVTADPAATAVDAEAARHPGPDAGDPGRGQRPSSRRPASASRRRRRPAASGGPTAIRRRRTRSRAGTDRPHRRRHRLRHRGGGVPARRGHLRDAHQLNLKCQTSEVAVTAVEARPEGNVDAGAIRVVPARYNRTVIRVTNPAATTGGTREEFPRVAKKDVDAALVQLQEDLEAQFSRSSRTRTGVPAGTDRVPGHRRARRAVAPTVDPPTLVGQEVESFTLGLSATGTVLAVDASPVEAIAERRLAASISPATSWSRARRRSSSARGPSTSGTVDLPGRRVRPSRSAPSTRRRCEARSSACRRPRRGRSSPYGEVDIVLWPGLGGQRPDARAARHAHRRRRRRPGRASPRSPPRRSPQAPPGCARRRCPSEPVPSG